MSSDRVRELIEQLRRAAAYCSENDTEISVQMLLESALRLEAALAPSPVPVLSTLCKDDGYRNRLLVRAADSVRGLLQAVSLLKRAHEDVNASWLGGIVADGEQDLQAFEAAMNETDAGKILTAKQIGDVMDLCRVSLGPVACTNGNCTHDHEAFGFDTGRMAERLNTALAAIEAKPLVGQQDGQHLKLASQLAEVRRPRGYWLKKFRGAHLPNHTAACICVYCEKARFDLLETYAVERAALAANSSTPLGREKGQKEPSQPSSLEYTICGHCGGLFKRIAEHLEECPRNPHTAPSQPTQALDAIDTLLDSLNADNIGLMKAAIRHQVAALRTSPSTPPDLLERAAKIAENGCLVPPDGGSPTDDEREMCLSIAAAIRALRSLSTSPGPSFGQNDANTPASARPHGLVNELEREIIRLNEELSAVWRAHTMYMNAWCREIGGFIRAKHHQIDGYVFRTRDALQESYDKGLKEGKALAMASDAGSEKGAKGAAVDPL